MWAGYHQLPPDSLFDRRALWVALAGFTVLLLASSALEALRLHSLQATLPLAPGGMLGLALSDGLSRLLGFTGATLFLLVFMAAGFSLFSGLSWLRFTDRVGASVEATYSSVSADNTSTSWLALSSKCRGGKGESGMSANSGTCFSCAIRCDCRTSNSGCSMWIG